MSEIETLIRREFHWLSDGANDDPNLAAKIIKASRRRKIRRFAFLALFTSSVSIFSILGYVGVTQWMAPEVTQVADVITPVEESNTQVVIEPENAPIKSAQNQSVVSEYPVSWEDSIGDLGAISKPAGIGDTLGGLKATSLSVSWSKCLVGKCPTSWTLSVTNTTEEFVLAAPSLMVYVDHSPLISTSRPLTLLPGAKANLIFTFPEFAEITNMNNKATWQWNWFLTAAR